MNPHTSEQSSPPPLEQKGFELLVPPGGTLPPATTPILLLAGPVTDTRGAAHPAARRQSAFLNPVVRCIGPITNERHPHVRGSRRPYRSRAVGDNENFEPLTEPLFSTAAMNFPAMSPPIRRSRFLVNTVASHTCDQIAGWLRITVCKSCDSVG